MKISLIVLSILFLLSGLASADKVCPVCGQVFGDDYNFCDHCMVNGKAVKLKSASDTTESTGDTKVVGPGIKLIHIPGGSFQMGSNEGEQDERPVHTVTVDSFWMGETEVTIGQYVAFLNEANPTKSTRKHWIAINGESSWYWTGKERKHGVNNNCHIYYSAGKYYADVGWDDYPVVNVSWYGTKAFCDSYSLRLPTEAEWEYAAGGPQHYKWSLGNEFDGKAYCYSGYQGSGEPPTKKVKSFGVNGYGLYEMSGNVWEWCSDWYGDYQSDTQRNPRGATSSIARVLRSGFWSGDAAYLRCAIRFPLNPADQLIDCNGFRVSGD